MKLGIVVVYLVKEEEEKLLDLHLNMIEKHTQVPYTIFASTNRLLPKFRDKLEHCSNIKLCECTSTERRKRHEHAFYLEQLVKIAIEDGVSHVVTLHVDSFPIRSDWSEELVGKLSKSCVLAAIMREDNIDLKPHPACLLFHRDFWLKYHPKFALSEAELSTPKYKQYFREFNHIHDSGVGYGYKIYSEGLSWYPLLKSNKGEDHYLIGTIYGDIIFHLGAAARVDKIFHRDTLWTQSSNTKNVIHFLRRFTASLLPQRIKTRIGNKILFNLNRAQSVNQSAYNQVRTQLIQDPESYLKYLRTGKR